MGLNWSLMRPNCDHRRRGAPAVASPAQRESATVETTYMLALRNEGPPPDAKRAQAALKYMPPDGPKATVKAEQGRTTGTTGRISGRGGGGSLGRMELAGTASCA